MSNSLINRNLLFISCMAAMAGKGWAEELVLEEVAVWGTRVKASSLNLDEDAIAIRQADHISDLLRTIPGVDVGGAHSLNQRITIRSMDDKDLRITIDGANQNTYMYHHMGNLLIHSDILQSADIEVGNNSVVNGGLGGVARFETREAKGLLLDSGQQFGSRVQVSAADNASKSYAFTGYGQITDQIDVLVYYNFVDRDNYRVGEEKILDKNGNEIPGTDGEVKGLKGEVDDALIKIGWDITDYQRLKLGYEAYADEGDYSYRPDMGLATDLAISNSLNVPLVFPTEFTRDTITLNYDLEWGGHSTFKAALFQNESTLWRDETGLASSSLPPIRASAAVNEGEAKNTGFNILANSVWGGAIEHSLTYGIDIINYETRYISNNIFSGVERSSEEASNKAIFIEDRIGFSNGLALIPGARYDAYDLESKVVDDTFNDSTFALAVEYKISESLLVRASSTQLFKGPEIGEVFIGAGLGDTPNPDIEAETGVNSELALAYQGEVFSSGITLFKTDIENYIYDYARIPGGGERDVWKDNVGDMQIDGFEAYAGFDQGNLSVLLSYSSAESEVSAFADYKQLDGARIDRQQGDTISLNLDYQFTGLDLALHWETLHVDDVNAGVDLDYSTLDTENAKDGFVVHNISIRWTPEGTLPGFALTLGVDNVFDEYYASQSSRTGSSFHGRFGDLYLLDYEPGRNIKATVSYQF